MLELSCKEFWRYSNITCCGYPLGALDSIQVGDITEQTQTEGDKGRQKFKNLVLEVKFFILAIK